MAEPTRLEEVDIVREELSIDLRPLAAKQPAEVLTIYHLDNRGPERTLDLVFAVGSAAAPFEVRLGEQVADTRPIDSSDLPASWQLPASTPGLSGEWLRRGLRPVGTDRLKRGGRPAGADRLLHHRLAHLPPPAFVNPKHATPS